MHYSFLLVNYNMAALVRNVIRNIKQCIPEHASFEIIVADNSTDPAHRLRAESFSLDESVRLVPLAENRGFVDALNRIMPLATGDYVVIMHPDVELKEGCLTSLTAFMEEHPRAGVVSPDLYYPDGSPNRIRLRFPALGTELRRCCNILAQIALRKKLLRDEIFWDRTMDTEADMVMSVCMMFRGTALRAVGSIDRRLTFYYSNDYLCARARQLGWSCHYVREAQAIHYERYTPTTQYSASEAMTYKQCPIAANPRMRSDYLVFLSACYSFGSRLGLRALALFEDAIELVAQCKRPWTRKNQLLQLLRSIAVQCGGRLP